VPCFIIQFSVDQDRSGFPKELTHAVDPLPNRFPLKSSHNLFPSIALILPFRSSSPNLHLKFEVLKLFNFILRLSVCSKWDPETLLIISFLRCPLKCTSPGSSKCVQLLTLVQGQSSRWNLLCSQVKGSSHQCRIQRPIYADWTSVIQICPQFVPINKFQLMMCS